MAMQQIICTSSSSSLRKYDAFISFHGKDTRGKFTNYLYDALSKKVVTFIDERKLEKGDEISSTLTKSIEEAYVSLVIFSEHYASSKWCLNELVKILECKKKQQIVIPVFYEVDPTDVRNQTGSYGQAFEKYELDPKHDKVKLQKWRSALTEAANLSGWHSQIYRIESDLIKDIVEVVRGQLNLRHPFEDNKKLVGIRRKYEEVEWLMKSGKKDIKTLVLWGMGGIGKTTLAEELYARWSYRYERRCLLKNVREYSTGRELREVRNELVSTLSEQPRHAPCLIVLDDVATLAQAENLNIVNNSLAPGSRVIVTTRDTGICSQFGECAIYEVQGFDRDESLQLFCRNAFGKEYVEVGYEELSERAIGYCGGNPLALQVLGANFHAKSKEVWESELEKLKEIPNGRIQKVLKLSYDDLDRKQKDIFLDIACFFSLRFVIYNIHDRDYLKILFNACGFFAACGIEVLLSKALITASCGTFEMHDLLVEMGREIVKQESPKDPGRRSHLWDSEDVYDVLKDNKGTNLVEVICFDTSKIEDLYLSSDSFKSMINLRYLHITSYTHKRAVHLRGGLERLSDKLRHLYWESFPLESLPSTFCAKNLVILNMQYSKLKKLWDGIQKLDNLVEINLDRSNELIEIPDLSRAPNLQIVSLICCVSLCQLHPSVFTCPKLRKLDLHGCKKIKSLKTNIHSKSFQTLCLSHCSSLVEFSVISEEMTTLMLDFTAIHEFPSSIWLNSKLTFLNISECKKLNIVRKKLSADLGLTSLTTLYLFGCTKINASNLWFILDGMPSLKVLDLRKCCNLETLPYNIQNNSLLEILKVDECSKLKSLPKLPKSLKQFTAFNCTYLDSNTLHKFQFNFGNKLKGLSDICYLPGGQVPSQFHYQTTEASIVIRPIPKSGLCGFIFCIVLSEGLDFRYDTIACTIYENGKEIHEWAELLYTGTHLFGGAGTLLLDHILLFSWYGDDELLKMGDESGGDHYNLSFEFKYYPDDEEEWSTEGIKGCGVFPVYSLEHSLQLDGRSSSALVFDEEEWSTKWIKGCGVFPVYGLEHSLGLNSTSSRVEIVELQSSALVIDELQHEAIEVGVSSDVYVENESDDEPDIDGRSYWYYKKAGSERRSDHYNLSFEFKASRCVDGDDEERLSTEGIKGCGVFPVYYLDGRSSSRVEIVELQSSGQVSNESDQHSNFDIDELQHQSATYENEDDQQQLQIPPEEKEEDLDDKSFCDCSIGLLLIHLLEESKRYFSSFSCKATRQNCNLHSAVSLDAED